MLSMAKPGPVAWTKWLGPRKGPGLEARAEENARGKALETPSLGRSRVDLGRFRVVLAWPWAGLWMFRDHFGDVLGGI